MRNAGSPFFCEMSGKNSENMWNTLVLTFFVVVKSLNLVYNAIDYAKFGLAFAEPILREI